MRKEPVVMIVLDGWGIGANNASNPIHAAGANNIEHIKKTYPYGVLQASGIAVGLPWGENGDSEVGHLTLGAGKVIYQDYPRISLQIKDGSFSKNEVLLEAIRKAKEKSSRVHLVGLIGRSNVYSSVEHLVSLVGLVKDEGAEPILHAITDGRDSPPKSALDIIADLPKIPIASVSGRFYGMDRDLHWDRTSKTYKAMVGDGEDSPAQNITQVLSASYGRGLTDEFTEPTLLDPARKISDGDSVIFFNFREDSTKQLAEMFANPALGEKHTIPQNLHVVTFTKYSSKLSFPVAFPAENVTNPLGKVIASRGMIQLRIAETEKYAHITFFFNGFSEAPFQNEYRVLIPSKNIARHDEAPEMMAREITTRVVEAVSEGVYDFILVNYANADILGHTGNIDAAIQAIQVIDEQIGILLQEILKSGGTLVITSDHGNVESMVDPQTGLPETTHNPSPVPLHVVRSGYERQKTDEFVKTQESFNVGVICDVAPTVLELMGIPKPDDMTGVSLLQSLR